MKPLKLDWKVMNVRADIPGTNIFVEAMGSYPPSEEKWFWNLVWNGRVRNSGEAKTQAAAKREAAISLRALK